MKSSILIQTELGVVVFYKINCFQLKKHRNTDTLTMNRDDSLSVCTYLIRAVLQTSVTIYMYLSFIRF